MSNPVGRPRTTTPPPEEVIELGKELLKWAEDDTKELRHHLNQWWCLKKDMSKVQWDCLCQKPEFLSYYKRATISLAQRFIDGSINQSIAQRFFRLYFPDLKKDENDLLVFKADLARKQEKVDEENQVRRTVQAIRELESQ